MRIEAVLGDITTQKVDAVVNAASPALLGGGGVDGAIHRAAGPRLLRECRELRRTRLPDGLAVGGAVVTSAYDLPATWVIHTVGPNRHAGQEDPALLHRAFRRSLGAAREQGCRSVALPAVSAGVYGWPKGEVARIAVAEARAVQRAVHATVHGADNDWAQAAAGAPRAGLAHTGVAGGVLAAGERTRAGVAVHGESAVEEWRLELVRFVLVSQEMLDAFQEELDRTDPETDPEKARP